jgi:hypothetical protein
VTDVWMVLIEDRQSDVDALPFSTEEAAVAKARDSVPEDAEEEQITDGMRKSGWVLYLPYGTEGDCVRVVKRAVDGEERR